MKRRALTLKTKLDIIRTFDSRPYLIHEDIAVMFNCSRSTITAVIKKKERLTPLASNVSQMAKKKLRKCKWPELESTLIEWVRNLNASCIPLTDNIIRAKSIILFKTVYADNQIRTKFIASNGWLAGFKSRHGLKRRFIHGEAATTNNELVKSSQKGLQILLSQYPLNDVFNADETGLFYRLLPNRTLAPRPQKGTKKLRDRITILLSTNATGTEKLWPFVISTAKNPV